MASLHPSPTLAVSGAELRDWAEVGAKLAAVLGLPALVAAWWRRRRARQAAHLARLAKEKELRDAQIELDTAMADIQRLEFAREDGIYTDRQYRDRRAITRDRFLKARNRLWEARGFPVSRDKESREMVAALRELTQTMRWKEDEAERIRDAVEEKFREAG